MIITKRMNKIRILFIVLLFAAVVIFPDVKAFASDEDEEYITITVGASDDNDNLKYSIDSTAPEAFSDCNTFSIIAGTSHTIYVKDAAGNITSQKYGDEVEENETEEINETDGIDEIYNAEETSETDETYDVEETEAYQQSETEGQDITIDVELGNDDHMTDMPAAGNSGEGTGTVSGKTVTDGGNDSDKIFYTVTTDEGDTFYMIVDQTQSTDNVYLLNTVSRADLQSLAVDDSSSGEETANNNLLSMLSSADSSSNNSADQNVKQKNDGSSRAFILMIVIAIMGGVYYYVKVYKNKKDEAMDIMDAMDMDDFEAEEELENDEEVDFDLDDAEKQEYLERLISEEDDLGEADDRLEGDIYDSPEDAQEEDIVADFETEYDEELDGEEI